jgi:DNA polymerase elongation subunit (family B)
MESISFEKMEKFLYGQDDEKYIVKLQYDYKSGKMKKYKEIPDYGKTVESESFTSFLFAKNLNNFQNVFYNGNQREKQKAIEKYEIKFKKLEKNENPRLQLGYEFLFYTNKGFKSLKDFFTKGGVNPYKNRDYFLIPTVEEQFLISKGKRLFKGFQTYDEIHKVAFDLETTGLDPDNSSIFLTGIRDNRGFEQIIKSESPEEEVEAIVKIFTIFDELNPTVLGGYNSNNFDWYFIFRRAENLGINLESDVFPYLHNIAPVKRKESFVKVGNETKDTVETTLEGVNSVDIIHSVEQAQAVDTDMKAVNLKYVTDYINLKKENRVYVEHQDIGDLYFDDSIFLFNDKDGKYFKKNLERELGIKFLKEVKQIKDGRFYCLDRSRKEKFGEADNIIYFQLLNIGETLEEDKKEIDDFIEKLKEYFREYQNIFFETSGLGNQIEMDKPETYQYLKEKLREFKGYVNSFEEVSGAYIIKRYLMDDLYETLQVDYNFSQSAFLLSQIVPEGFQSLYTAGTATLWNLLMVNWSYFNQLAIPAKEEKRDYVGGLSRMVNAGYAENIVKFDFASLYPSTQLTWDIFPDVDFSDALKAMLYYFYNERFKAKHLMKKHKKEGDKELANFYDRKQAPLKIFINSLYGGLSAVQAFNWSEIFKAEYVTCVSRQFLRMMVYFFSQKGYKPLIGDSVTGDMPVYIKYENGNVDIVPIKDIFDENNAIENNGKRDFSEKPYYILSKNGWVSIKYVYKHFSNKNIHAINTKNSFIKVTEDHSLFQDGKEVTPKELKTGDKIDLYQHEILNSYKEMSYSKAWLIGFFVGDGSSIYNNRKKTYLSKRKNKYVQHNGKRVEFTLNNQNKEILKEAQNIINIEYGVNPKIKDYNDSSNVYKLKTHHSSLAKWFSENCYTTDRLKKIPSEILESSKDAKLGFLDGLYCADGDGYCLFDSYEITQKSPVLFAGLKLLLDEIGEEVSFNTTKDKQNIYRFRFLQNSDKENNENNSVKYNKIQSQKEAVYDVSTEDGTFICGINGVVAHNTDGFNFSKPDDVDTHVYTAYGCHSMTEEGTYYGMDADVAEFNERYMQGYMGLDVDGEWPSTINVSRKNYALLESNKIKLIGNTLKSKNLPEYISEFFNNGLRMLLEGKGKDFVEYYYETLEKIYHQDIPLKKIAQRAKVKQSMEDYLNRGVDVNGKPKARQGHMELAYELGLQVNIGDIIYYVNGGTAKSHGFVDRHKKGANKGEFYGYWLPNRVIEQFPDLKGHYNVPKAIDAFNERVQILLICFHPDVRKRILKPKPEDREYFTDNELELVNGYAFRKPQDDYEFIMTPEEGEMRFWQQFNIRYGYNYKPDFWLDEDFEFDLPNFISPIQEHYESAESNPS